ncbi:MAG TPA: choline/carnitine O-acyltransferase [Acidimicrobiales bacterium]
MTPPRTFDLEDSLPRVPLPTPAASARRFLEWCDPLLTDDERAATRAAVDDFLRPDGPVPLLQAALERYDATPGVRSWLDRFWPSRYLGRRDRIALNANFFFLFNDPPVPEGQVERAAGLIAGALAHKRRVDDETLPPVTLRGRPQSMEQHRFLFSTTRIPGADQDTVRAPYSDEWPGPSPFRHVVVFHHGHAFRMDVIGPDGAPHSLDDLEDGLEAVLKAGTNPAPTDTSIGRLTTKARAEWAASRERLVALDPANRAALDTIETALFCVCLDDLVPADTLAACDQLLHGDSGNRWFDKAVSFVVFADGTAGINVEHCGLDGTTILQFVDAIASATAPEHAAAAGARSQGVPVVEPVEVVLDDDLRADVQAAGDDFAAFAAANATTRVALPGFGSDRIKQLGVSPDAFVQMSYQLAHRRTKGLVGATYESIATRQYQNGRTEAMRVVTPESVAFVTAMDDPAATPDDRRAALRAATDAHVARSRACQQGDAPEQHLWELLLVQQREGEALGGAATRPIALFDSPGWRIMRDDYLSTSSAPSVHIQHFGFGATSDRCIGVAYVLLPDRLNLYLSTPKAVAEPMHRFGEEVARALAEMEALVTAG